MYDLWIGSVVAALVVGVFVWGLIFWCVVRYRKRGDELPPQTRYNMPFEILYTVAPFVIIAVLFFYTAIIQADVDRLSKNPDVNVEVIASKWNWQFECYRPTARKEPGRHEPITTVGADATDPGPGAAGRTSRCSSRRPREDVIHSFWVPDILFKRDVIPGAGRTGSRQPVKVNATPVHYVGRCAELCGTYHSMMNFELRVVSAEQLPAVPGALAAGRRPRPEALAQLGFPNQGVRDDDASVRHRPHHADPPS